jgi:SAM-dependent methyltransferase
MSFPVSIKGVLLEAGCVVLLENERSEWELPGGRLEAGEDPAACLAREFAEELGVKIAVKAILDSWVYEVLPARHVVIVTYGVARIDRAALRLSHEHRRLGLFVRDDLDRLPMPEGYRRSIRAWMARGENNVEAENKPRRPFYDGATLHVRTYDSINTGNRLVVRDDASFYRDLARRAGGEVLEIGVGTGRVALELAQAGVRVTGLDASAAMLAIAAGKAAAAGLSERLRLEQGDMRGFDLSGRAFALAIVPFRAFQCLLSAQDQRAALAAFRRHLRSGGILALHLFDPDLRFLLPGASGPIDRQHGTDRDTGRPVEAVLETALFDHVNQVRRDLWRYRAFAADGTIAEEEALELSLRWTYRWEMRHLLELSGFAVEAEFSDFAGSPPAYGKEQIWVAHKS